jgi:poly-gamma-glutamate synthesis protein (capsule biosynthesis protein)
MARLPSVAVAAKGSTAGTADANAPLRLFLCGDVMTGRGIDQILPHPSGPALYESYVRDARDYVELAERANGPIPRQADFSYIWGDVLAEFGRRGTDARIVNLETAVTTGGRPAPKGINYRMQPANAPSLNAAGLDCCVLANNHVLDWGREGLMETLATLGKAGIRTAGAGQDLAAAQAPAILPARDQRRVLVFGGATPDCGIPEDWAASPAQSGVHLLRDLSVNAVDAISACVRRYKRSGDIAIFSVHWGGNWGYGVPPAQRVFAHGLIDSGAVDLVHGHSSHHVKAVEVHHGKLILYGAGDFLNDYEGIEGHGEYRGDLGLMYFPRLGSADGQLVSLEMVPTRVRRFRVERAGADDRRWLIGTLAREYGRFGANVREQADGTLALHWT